MSVTDSLSSLHSELQRQYDSLSALTNVIEEHIYLLETTPLRSVVERINSLGESVSMLRSTLTNAYDEVQGAIGEAEREAEAEDSEGKVDADDVRYWLSRITDAAENLDSVVNDA